MDFVANDMKFDHFIIKQWDGRFKVWGSGFGVQGCSGGFAAIFMGRCPKVVFKLQVTSHSAPLIPSYSSLLSYFRVVVAASPQYLWGDARRCAGCQVSRFWVPPSTARTRMTKIPHFSRNDDTRAGCPPSYLMLLS